MVSEIFFVKPSLTLLCAALCNFIVCSIASATPFLSKMDLCFASVANDIDSATSGVQGPRGSVFMLVDVSVDFLFSVVTLSCDAIGLTDDTERQIKSKTLLLSEMTAFNLFLALSRTCICF